MKHRILPIALAALFLTGPLHAQVPALINYQGRVAVDATNFEGTGQFKFALVDQGFNANTQATASAIGPGQVFFINVINGGSGYVAAPAVTITDPTGTGATAVATVSFGFVSSIQITNGGSGYSTNPTVTIAPPPPNIFTNKYWSNDDSGGGLVVEPATAVSLPVTKGLYSVLLGDSTIPNMAAIGTGASAPIYPPDMRLRVWFNDGTHGFQLLSPDQRLAPAAYLAHGTVTSATIADGAINSTKIANNTILGSNLSNQTITASKIAPSSLDFTLFAAGGAPTTGQVLGFNGTGLTWSAPVWTLNGTNDAYYNGGNVGIGTDIPTSKLEIAAQDGLAITGYQPFLTLRDANGGNKSGFVQSINGDIILLTSNRRSLVVKDGTGVVQVRTLQIIGGADLAEPFLMKEEELEKGSVVVIDDEHPGRLKRSAGAYDTRVAGIISGANGVNPGIALHQEGVMEGGQNVALTGRVYVRADASNAPIKPGDLLTTSDLPGHAMKVTDHAKAQGAVIGKAMSSLTEGTGMVLVLVTLQ